MNDHRLKPVASGYGLKPDQVGPAGRLLHNLEVIVWYFRFLILDIFLPLSSVTLPLVSTQYPRPHKCCPQYRFRSDANSDNSLCELFPFSSCTALETDKRGGMPISIWT